MPCYQPPPTAEEINMWKREARQRAEKTGDWSDWYDLLDKSEIIAMLCDVVTMLPEGSRIHEDIAHVYQIHKQKENAK